MDFDYLLKNTFVIFFVVCSPGYRLAGFFSLIYYLQVWVTQYCLKLDLNCKPVTKFIIRRQPFHQFYQFFLVHFVRAVAMEQDFFFLYGFHKKSFLINPLLGKKFNKTIYFSGKACGIDPV
jgi:hypothetical protein